MFDNLCKIEPRESAFIVSKINRLPPQGLEHDFNNKVRYFARASVVDRKSVTIINTETELDDYVT